MQEAGPSASTLIDLLRRRDATEASGLGAAGATILAAINRRLSLDVVRQVARETMLTTAFIFGLFVGANAFALVLRGLGGDEFGYNAGHLPRDHSVRVIQLFAVG